MVVKQRRFSMTDEFLTPTEDFLAFVEGKPEDAIEFEVEVSPNVDRVMPLDNIQLPEGQPRRYFSGEALESLTASVRKHGILQPILVRPLESGNGYELVAGERRYRAAKGAGLTEIPVIIRTLSDRDTIQVALLENLQREDLNPVEETEAVLQLLCMSLDCSTEHLIALLNQVEQIKRQGNELTDSAVRREWEQVEKVFEVVGRFTPDSFRSHRLPLLNLPKDILEALRQGVLEYTKAREIAKLKDKDERQKLLAAALAQGLTLREITARVKVGKTPQERNNLLERVEAVYKKLKRAKAWKDPKKRKNLEKAISQLESFLD